MRRLTDKEAAFVQEYLLDLNATQAAIRAKYSPRSAKQTGSDLLGRPAIQAALQQAMTARAQRTEIKADRVLEEIAHGAFLDPATLFNDNGTLKALHEMPESARRCIAGIKVEETFEGTGKDREWTGYLKEIKLVSKEGMLTLAGKHLKIFTDKVEHSGTVQVVASPLDERL